MLAARIGRVLLFHAVYPGRLNSGPLTQTRTCCANTTVSNLVEIDNGSFHQGIARLLYFLPSKHLPYSIDDVHKVCSDCSVCAKLNPLGPGFTPFWQNFAILELARLLT